MEEKKKRNCPLLAADAIAIKNNKFLLLITRGHEPCKGTFALPGGHVEYGEDPKISVIREL